MALAKQKFNYDRGSPGGLNFLRGELLSIWILQSQVHTADEVQRILFTFDWQGPRSGGIERRTLTQSRQTQRSHKGRRFYLLHLLCSAVLFAGDWHKIPGFMRLATKRRVVGLLRHSRRGQENRVHYVLYASRRCLAASEGAGRGWAATSGDSLSTTRMQH